MRTAVLLRASVRVRVAVRVRVETIFETAIFETIVELRMSLLPRMRGPRERELTPGAADVDSQTNRRPRNHRAARWVPSGRPRPEGNHHDDCELHDPWRGAPHGARSSA